MYEPNFKKVNKDFKPKTLYDELLYEIMINSDYDDEYDDDYNKINQVSKILMQIRESNNEVIKEEVSEFSKMFAQRESAYDHNIKESLRFILSYGVDIRKIRYCSRKCAPINRENIFMEKNLYFKDCEEVDCKDCDEHSLKLAEEVISENKYKLSLPNHIYDIIYCDSESTAIFLCCLASNSNEIIHRIKTYAKKEGRLCFDFLGCTYSFGCPPCVDKSCTKYSKTRDCRKCWVLFAEDIERIIKGD